jgi:hypothetical protein
LAEKGQMADGLKIETKTGQILYDSSWIAGVDYDEDNYDEDHTDATEKETESDSEESEVYDEMDPNELADILNDKTAAINEVENDRNNSVQNSNNSNPTGDNSEANEAAG